MKTNGKFEVINKERKSGTSSKGQAWEKVEYLLKNTFEREDGSWVETMIVADASTRIDELNVGDKIDATLFISSRPFEKDGKTMHFVSFRITHVESYEKSKASADKQAEEVSAIDDTIPF